MSVDATDREDREDREGHSYSYHHVGDRYEIRFDARVVDRLYKDCVFNALATLDRIRALLLGEHADAVLWLREQGLLPSVGEEAGA